MYAKWKPILAGTVVLAIAGSTLAIAQSRPGREGPRMWRPSVEDMRAFGEARLAGLKAGLALTAEQEKAWPAFEQAAREFTKLRLDRMSAASGPARQTDPVEWMNRRATAMMETGSALKKLGDATAPLYSSLDENQKRRFDVLSRLGRFGDREFRGRDGRHGPRGMMRRTENDEHTLPPHGMMPGGMMRPGMQNGMMPNGTMSPMRGEERL
jgi:zinc resistance-associated protein